MHLVKNLQMMNKGNINRVCVYIFVYLPIIIFFLSRSSLEYNRFGNNLPAEFQTQTVTDDDDSFSTTSWEEELVSEIEDDSASEEDEDFKAPVKYTPKKYKKSMHPTIHPLSKKSSCESLAPITNNLFVDNTDSLLPKASPRPTSTPTIYQKLTKANIDWCRYCGTTEGVNWRPGPWGKRTLCK